MIGNKRALLVPVLQYPFERSCRTVGSLLESFHTVVKGRGIFPSLPVFFGIHGHWDLHHIFMVGWYLDAVAVSWQQRNLLCLNQPRLMGKAGYWVLSNSVFYWYYKQPTVLKGSLSFMLCGHFLMMEKLLEAFCIARVKISSETCDSPSFHSSK